MGQTKNIVGQRFDRLVVISNEGPLGLPKRREFYWKCQCDCGSELLVIGSKLRNQHTRSCGCLRDDKTAARQRTHGLSNHPAFSSWNSMMSRCFNPLNPAFHHYGGRGISVCERWKSVENFIADMGDRPKGTSIERIDNSKGYSPENCKWATQTEQLRNTRSNVLLTFNGETKCLTQWAEEVGISTKTLQGRLKSNWPVIDALMQPIQQSVPLATRKALQVTA
jgi:hypothetical protein